MNDYETADYLNTLNKEQKLSLAIEKWGEFCTNQHDVVCNQKYSKTLPYSFHLNCVVAQAGVNRRFLDNSADKFIVILAAWGHDLIEDARMTYNDVVTELFSIFVKLEISSIEGYSPEVISERVANVIYAVTDEKGKNRAERKSKSYYSDLIEDRLAIYTKLSDLSANRLFSKLTGSSMYKMYIKEFPNFIDKLYREEFRDFFEYVNNI